MNGANFSTDIYKMAHINKKKIVNIASSTSTNSLASFLWSKYDRRPNNFTDMVNSNMPWIVKTVGAPENTQPSL